MCGIAGYITKTKIDISVLKSMVNALYHRGPDAEGFYYSESYNAGMRRLSINDLEYGNQPLYNEDRSVVLFYNGEYWGVHNLREKIGKYYLADNYQIPPEQAIILENQAQVIEGSNHDFLALINFITSQIWLFSALV